MMQRPHTAAERLSGSERDLELAGEANCVLRGSYHAKL